MVQSELGGEQEARTVSSKRVLATVVALIVALDQVTKHWALNHLDDGHVDHLFWTLQFNLSFNSGMAFGQGQGWGPVIGALAMVVVVILVLSIRRQNDRRSTAAVGLIVGGALGNLVDRIFRGDGWLHGEVIDFIDFQWFPIFNVADIAVNVGGVLFVLTYVRSSKTSVAA